MRSPPDSPAEGTPLNRTSIGEILAEEGFGGLLRHAKPPAPTAGTPTLPKTGRLDFASWPTRVDTRMAGLLLAVPAPIALDLPARVATKLIVPGGGCDAAAKVCSIVAGMLTGADSIDDLGVLRKAPCTRCCPG